MSKRILYLTFYFEPDLCAGSFRNSPLATELAKLAKERNIDIDVYTTLPNRYKSFSRTAPEYEVRDNITIRRIKLPSHKSGVADQVRAFAAYYKAVWQVASSESYDLVFASSSRLFTAFLGYRLAKQMKVPLYLDVRDIFVDTIKDVFPNKIVRTVVLPMMKFIERRTFGYARHINLISGGFRQYFSEYTQATYTEFTNGIDPVFLGAASLESVSGDTTPKTIVYAGNIGEGQGLHKIVPEAARLLGPDYKFRIIGDGGARSKLEQELQGVKNVEIIDPVDRNRLISEYSNADFLFMHLNDYDAFKKVLPSKVFELGVFPKPMIAGVAGYAREFVDRNLPASILIEPCNGVQLAAAVSNYKDNGSSSREEFIRKYNRASINTAMALSILEYI